MAFKLGDVIIDRLQFGYGANKKTGNPLYALTQLNETTIELTSDSTDIKNKDGSIVYRKYSGKTGEVNAQNAFINLAVIETISAADAEMASKQNTLKVPMMQTIAAGKTLNITGFVEGSVVVSAMYNGAIDANKTYKLGSAASDTEFAITSVAADESAGTPASATLTPPTDAEEIEYFVKYTKEITSGAKITIAADKYPKAHELFFKALAVDKCDDDNFKPVIVHIPEFIPSPDLSLALQGGDNQTMDYKGTILTNTCSTDQTLIEIFYIDEEEDVA